MNFLEVIKKIPTPMCGLALAIASLGNLLSSYFQYARVICGIISTIIITGYIIRIFIDRVGIKLELSKVVPLSVFPTLFMTIFTLSGYIAKILPLFSKVIWALALVGFLITLIVFVKRWVIHLDINNVFPSWFVIALGYMVGAIPSNELGTEKIGGILAYVGFSLYMLVLPLIVYRVFIRKNQNGHRGIRTINEDVRPTFTIFAAPANLAIVAQFGAFSDDISKIILITLIALAIPSYLMVLYFVPQFLNGPFYPSYAALTFPLVISTISAFKVLIYFEIENLLAIKILLGVMSAIATFVIAYVFVGYTKYLFGRQENIIVNRKKASS